MIIRELLRDWLELVDIDKPAEVRALTRNANRVAQTERIVRIARIHNGRLVVENEDLQQAEEIPV